LGFLSTYDAHTKELYRLGLFEVPLTQSPGQRLDSISEYGYFGTAVGHNDLALNAPRLGFETERGIGNATLIGTLAFGEFKGSAYGGAPVFTGTTTTAARPEIGLYGRLPITSDFQLNAQIMDGARNITLPGQTAFVDAYDRIGFRAAVARPRQRSRRRQQRHRLQRRISSAQVFRHAALLWGFALRRGRQSIPDPNVRFVRWGTRNQTRAGRPRAPGEPPRWNPDVRRLSYRGRTLAHRTLSTCAFS
jgi:hypothetical protein